MTGKLQGMIDQANRKTQAQRGRQFARKATDAQMLEALLVAADRAVTAYKLALRAGRNADALQEEMCVLAGAVSAAKTRAK